MGAGGTQARRASASEGDFRAAIRYRCLAVLLAWTKLTCSCLTVLLLTASTSSAPPVPSMMSLQALLSRFEAIWYGNSPTNAAEWTQYDASASSIEDHIISQRKAKAA